MKEIHYNIHEVFTKNYNSARQGAIVENCSVKVAQRLLTGIVHV